MQFARMERERTVQIADRSLLLPRDPHVFFLRDGQNFPVACVASKVMEDGPWAQGTIRFAVSVCNPLDRKVYDPKKARKIALGRLETPRKLVGEVPVGPNVKVRIMQAITVGIDGPRPFPKHVRAAANLWLADKHLRDAERGNARA